MKTIKMINLVMLMAMAPTFAMEEFSNSRLIIRGQYTVADILGKAHLSDQLDLREHELLNSIVFPLVPHRYDHMAEILRGAHLVINDNGQTYMTIAALFGLFPDVGTHEHKTPELKFNLATLGTLLTGIKGSLSWLRLESMDQSKYWLEMPKYLLDAKKPNFGPFGISWHTEEHEPIIINNACD